MRNLTCAHRPPDDPLIDLRRDAAFRAVDDKVMQFTMTSPEAKWALYEAIRHIVVNRIPGDFVECGVWKGGSAMLAALEFLKYGSCRTLWLYDTFDGMTKPTPEDGPAAERWDAAYMKVDEATVRKNVLSTGYPSPLVKLVKGDVSETLKETTPECISILRLDTDFYRSTLDELTVLWPLLHPGGILIVDDYGAWPGCKKAVTEFFGPAHLLHRIDYSVRLLVKP